MEEPDCLRFSASIRLLRSGALSRARKAQLLEFGLGLEVSIRRPQLGSE